LKKIRSTRMGNGLLLERQPRRTATYLDTDD
jgi:hypothetical protein